MGVFNKAVVFGYIYQLQSVKENKDNIVEELRKINQVVPIVKTNDFGHNTFKYYNSYWIRSYN